ncbi:PREDICTED: uncharacterized protein LOC108551605 isoform X2 [Eufriesea mexicana]|uniref:uncharacterized protein LOC108551605 isoform X2 n=1 Tax=Eufriesea mexicana TaxID=516756 RepID=UPI00083BF1FC|nr:PREDICTED: uncharacterized protein LOC108551605 isoform X2 [Eufriesea mexicana]
MASLLRQGKQSDQQKKAHRLVAEVSLLYSAYTSLSLLLCHSPCRRLVSGKSTYQCCTVSVLAVVLHQITSRLWSQIPQTPPRTARMVRGNFTRIPRQFHRNSTRVQGEFRGNSARIQREFSDG